MNINLLKKRRTSGAALAALAGLACATMATEAWAGPRRGRVVRHVPVRDAVRVMPAYETVRYVPAASAACTGRIREVWREPVYEERRVLVTLPATVVTRRVPRLDLFGVVVAYDVVKEVLEPAREVWRTERVLLRPGRYDTVCEPVFVQPATRVVHRAARFQGHHGPRWRPPAVRTARLHGHPGRHHAAHGRHGRDRGLTIRVRR